jgi:hypothetical protein
MNVSASFLLFGWVLFRCRFGFDFTDEGFYLNWISNPKNFRASVTQFGFVYHPLYKLIGGDIALLRQINALIIFILSCTLCVVLFRSVCKDWTALRSFQRLGFIGAAVVLASSSLAFFDPWIPSPSYNSLALQALIVTAIGMILADRKLSMESTAGWILIGIGGGCSFLAKPTTAAILGCLTCGYTIVAGKFRLRGLFVSIATATLILFVAGLAIDGSLSSFFRRFAEGLDMMNRLNSHPLNAFFRQDRFRLSDEQESNFVSVLILTFALSALGFFVNHWARFGAALIATLLAGISIATVGGVFSPNVSYEPFQPMQFWAIWFGIILAAILFPIGRCQLLSRKGLPLVVFFAIFPYAYAFGTNENLWAGASPASLFWVLSGFVVCASLAAESGSWRTLLPLVAITLLVSTVILYLAMENPYRQLRSLRLQTSAVEINRERAEIFLTDESASYVRELYRLASENGFKAGDPMLDLTGVSPGVLYAIGARSLGVASAFGGYPGSSDFVRAGLDQVSCRAIGLSWILTEPSSPQYFDSDLLERYGINVAHDFRVVGSIHSNSSRFIPPQIFEQQLLKPTRSLDVARMACEHARGNYLAREIQPSP